VWRDVVFPRYIFSSGLPRTVVTGRPPRVFKLTDFVVSVERLAWAKANGCRWGEETCFYVALGGSLEAVKWAWEQTDPPWDGATWVRRCRLTL
jgi:hypothetical protein